MLDRLDFALCQKVRELEGHYASPNFLLPQSLPYVFVGLDVAIVLSVIAAIVGEFVGAQAGLGYLIL